MEDTVVERKADASVRFSQHQSGNVTEGFMEPVDNQLAYGEDTARITITPGDIAGQSNYRFYENASEDMLPTYDRVVEIAKMCGKSISSRKGTSICGMGQEAFAMNGRPKNTSIVKLNAEIVRNGLSYGYTMIVDGVEEKITCNIHPETKSTSMNSYVLSANGLQSMTKEQLNEVSYQLSEKLYFIRERKPSYTLHLDASDYEGNRVINKYIEPFDALYESSVRGTENFKELSFSFINDNGEKEDVVIKMSDISDVEKSVKNPNHCGVAVVYDGISTVQRGTETFKVLGVNPRATYHGIRINVFVGDSMFTFLHSETQVKHRTSRCLFDIKDKYGAPVRFMDENGAEISAKDIKKKITSFIEEHKNDSAVRRKKKEDDAAIVLNGFSYDELVSAHKVVSAMSKDDSAKKFGPGTISNILKRALKQKNREYKLVYE